MSSAFKQHYEFRPWCILTSPVSYHHQVGTPQLPGIKLTPSLIPDTPASMRACLDALSRVRNSGSTRISGVYSPFFKDRGLHTLFIYSLPCFVYWLLLLKLLLLLCTVFMKYGNNVSLNRKVKLNWRQNCQDKCNKSHQ